MKPYQMDLLLQLQPEVMIKERIYRSLTHQKMYRFLDLLLLEEMIEYLHWQLEPEKSLQV